MFDRALASEPQKIGVSRVLPSFCNSDVSRIALLRLARETIGVEWIGASSSHSCERMVSSCVEINYRLIMGAAVPTS